uniref:Cytochrome P450 3A11 n=1 Tax=Magallana gigas TaxID=29159 RepID=K1QU45_MAGGI
MVTLVLLVLALVTLIAFFVFSRRRHNLFKQLNIPGPEPTRFLGIIPQIKEKGIAKTDLELIAKYGQNVGVFVGHRPVLLTSDADVIQEVCVKKFQCFRNRASILNLGCTLEATVALAKDEKWEFLRRRACAYFSMDVLCSSLFGHHVTSHKNPGEDFVKKVLEAFEAGNKTIIKPVTLCAIFPALRHWFWYRKFNPISKKTREFFDCHMLAEIERRGTTENRCKDLLQSMLEADGNSNTTGDRNGKCLDLSLSELTANSLFFVLSGYETVANALALTVLCLAEHPECQKKLTSEIRAGLETRNSTPQKDTLTNYENIQKLKYLDQCVNESLRLFPPFLRFNRSTNKESLINGITIPKGLDVAVSVYAVHHNSNVWDEPEKFDPDRFSEEKLTPSQKSHFLPFGLGPRDCFGKDFALMEVKIALVHLLQRYEVSTLPETEYPPVLEKGNFSKAENGIKLKFSERKQ